MNGRLTMKTFRPLILLIPLLSGCSLFDTPRSKPSHQPFSWASQTVRDANNAERDRMKAAVERGKE